MTNSVLVFGYGNPDRGEQFELGKPASRAAAQNIERAVAFAADILARRKPEHGKVLRHA